LKKIFLTPLVIFLNIFLVNNLTSQDLHYSQFYNSPQNVNPANVGLFNGDQRFLASVRDQWRFVPVPWFTVSGAFDQQVMTKNPEKNLIGLGVNFNHDRQGDSKLNLTNLNVSASYHYFLHPRHIVSLGGMIGFASRGFDYNSLTWDKQWTGDRFDPGAPTGENFDFQRIYFIDNAAGLNYRYQKDSRTHIDIGASMFHIIRPVAAFYNTQDSKLPSHIALNGVANVKLFSIMDLQLHALHQIQGVYNETLFGGLFKFHISQKPGKIFQLHLGGGYRTAKSYIPTLALQYNEFYASFSYDIDDNEFNRVLQSNRGGPEFHFRYVMTKVKSLGDHKVCPIY
jgi:type IX secretion system PorP/SprF family membrane protein